MAKGEIFINFIKENIIQVFEYPPNSANLLNLIYNISLNLGITYWHLYHSDDIAILLS